MNSVIELAEKLAKTPKILVVDDDKFIRFAFTAMRQDHYLDVECANNPNDALIMLQSGGPYDVVFLDMKFGDGADGMDVLRRINFLNLDVHVVVMSGSINLHDVMAEANRLGVLSFMAKPTSFTHDFVFSVLRRVGVKMIKRPTDDPGPKVDWTNFSL